MWCVAMATHAGLFIFTQPSSSSAGSVSANRGKQYDNNSLIRVQWHRHRPNHASATSIGTFQCSSSSSSFPSAPRPPMRPMPMLEEELCLVLSDIKANCKTWSWRGHKINYLVFGAAGGGGNDDITTSNPRRPLPLPLLLVHGFGASIAHWRRNIVSLSRTCTVYAVDLLGFGASDKPRGFTYSMETWSQLILDFLNEIIQRPTVLIGNSVGSLACLIATAEHRGSLIRGLALLNCAGGMNNKAIVDDWRIKLLMPLLWFIDLLLKQRPIASFIFDKAKQRDNIRNILLSIYGNKDSVDEDLVERDTSPVWQCGSSNPHEIILTLERLLASGECTGKLYMAATDCISNLYLNHLFGGLGIETLDSEIIREPADDEGALDAFVSIVTGPPGPSPVQLIPNINLPVLVLWGDQDPFTPLDGPVGKYFASISTELPNIHLFILDGVGHCPHDDRADLVHARLLPWLSRLQTLQNVNGSWTLN